MNDVRNREGSSGDSLYAASRPRYVTFEETGERRTVKRGCKRCGLETEIDHSFIVSPRGIAHHGGDYGETDCGKDATGSEWWWPL